MCRAANNTPACYHIRRVRVEHDESRRPHASLGRGADWMGAHPRPIRMVVEWPTKTWWGSTASSPRLLPANPALWRLS